MPKNNITLLKGICHLDLVGAGDDTEDTEQRETVRPRTQSATQMVLKEKWVAGHAIRKSMKTQGGQNWRWKLGES